MSVGVGRQDVLGIEGQGCLPFQRHRLLQPHLEFHM